jgi:hypothetical protein
LLDGLATVFLVAASPVAGVMEMNASIEWIQRTSVVARNRVERSTSAHRAHGIR